MASRKEAKNVFTTHEVSRMLQVNPRSVINWIDQTLLGSYKTPGGHRRIRKQDLLSFLRKHKIPLPPALTEDKFKLLIVDDDESVVKVIRKFFDRREIFEIVAASDGISALIEIGRTPPDLMILDILIPGVDGMEVCRRMKEDRNNSTSIIAISGRPEMEPRILQAGADCFLEKPLDLEQMFDEAKRLLGIL